MVIIRTEVKRVSQELIRAFKEVEPATIGHFRSFGFMSSEIKPVFDEIKIVGTAITVRIPSVDSALVHKVLGMVEEGDVIVIDRCGDTEHACWGEVTTVAAEQRGVAGVIVDGAVTDIVEIKKRRFPLFYKTVSALTTKLLGLDGEINTIIQCGGVPVRPGDLIVGDASGVVVISPEDAPVILEKAIRMQEEEKELLKKLESEALLPDLTKIDDLLRSRRSDT